MPLSRRHYYVHVFTSEANAILQIPLNPTWHDGKLIWNYTSNDIYTIKSRYRVGMDFTKSITLTKGPSNMNQESKLWNYIHNLPIQPKLGIFLWKVVLNILPKEKIF